MLTARKAWHCIDDWKTGHKVVTGFVAAAWEAEYEGILRDMTRFQSEPVTAPIMMLLCEHMIGNIK